MDPRYLAREVADASQQERKIFGALMAADKVVPLHQQNQHHHQIHHNNQTLHQQNHHHHHHQFHHKNQTPSIGMMMQASSSSSPLPGSFNINKDGEANNLGDLDRDLFDYLDIHHRPLQQQEHYGMRPQFRNFFLSNPMHGEPWETTSQERAAGLVSSVDVSGPSESKNDGSPASDELSRILKREEIPKSPSSCSDAKTQRRLAQNREAARKSRLRKKAYIEQLEASNMRLAQLEYEVERVKSQGVFLGGMMDNIHNASSATAVFDMEYARWVEEHSQRTVQLSQAVNQQLSENELLLFVNNHLAHYRQLFNLKDLMLKYDAYYIFSGTWKTPAERYFMWLGGFRPTKIIKVVIHSLMEGLTDVKLVEMYKFQQSTCDAEEALSQRVDALHQAITYAITRDSLVLLPNMATYTANMDFAVTNLSLLKDFIRQADNLRQRTLHRLQEILSIPQTAHCFLAIDEYIHRLRALSNIWLARSRQG